MELWVITDKPSPHKIHNMIIQVAKFLFEFSRSAHASPDFLRLGIDLDSLNLFGESLDPEMRGLEMMSKKNSSHGESTQCDFCLDFLVSFSYVYCGSVLFSMCSSNITVYLPCSSLHVHSSNTSQASFWRTRL